MKKSKVKFNQVQLGDRLRYWTNFNTDLYLRICQLKNTNS